jgi:tetratricopeptide (TPR) repeat protein
LAYQAQSIISIDNIGISIWGWVLGGSILGLYIQVKSKDTEEKIKSKRTLLQPTISILITLPTLLITYSFYEFERDAYMVRSNSNQNSSTTNDYIDKVLNNPLSDPYYKFESALSLANIGQLERAKLIIQELHAKDPKNLDYLRWLLSYQLEYKNYNKAISYYKQISLIDPWNVKNLLGLGLLYKELGDEANKNLILKQILQIAPNSEISLEAMKNL